jgi:DNA primase
MDPVDEIKQKLNIVNVIGEYVQLRRVGTNWKGLCPFHNEKTPSFMVHEEEQYFYCFGCNSGGDLFTFVQKLENLEFPEALKLLAKKAGVQLRDTDERTHSLKNRLHSLLEEATSYWQRNLVSPLGDTALAYLRDRKLDDKTLETFKLGYASDGWDNLLNYLRGKGYSESEIFQAGLTIKREKGSGYYDRFRERVTFPIADLHGNIIGFTARALKKDEMAKYINTPETLVYHKGSVLYGLDKAKDAIKTNNFVIFVEGNMDLISSHRVGVKNVVAVSGTALTQDQIDLIKRYTSNVAFCFDMDEAGQNAAKRSIDIALANDLNIKVIQVLEGKDPDDCIRANPADWAQSIERAKSIMQYYFDETLPQYDLKKPEHKKVVAQKLLVEINKIRNKVEQDHWIRELANLLNVDDKILREEVTISKVAPTKVLSPVAVTDAKDNRIWDLFFSLLLNDPAQLSFVLNEITAEMLPEAYQKLYTVIALCYNKNNKITKTELFAEIDKEPNLSIDKNFLNSLVLAKDRDADLTGEGDNTAKEIIKLVHRIKIQFLNDQSIKLEKAIKAAEQSRDTTLLNDLLSKLQEISQEKNRLRLL